MAVPTVSCDHTAGFVDSPAESVDPMVAFSFRQYGLLEPVMEIARYHLYEQIQFIAFMFSLNAKPDLISSIEGSTVHLWL